MNAFVEMLTFQVKPNKVDDFEAFLETMKHEMAQQEGCLSVRCFKRFYNGNAATAYYNAAGDYVVVDDITHQLVQLSKFGDIEWDPDSSIVDPYLPNR